MKLVTFAMLATIATATFVIAPPSFADSGTDFLKTLVGEWKGRGVMQAKPGSKPEAVICQFKSRLSQNGRRINNSGFCAGAQAKANVSGSLSYNPSTRKFTGQMLSTGSEEGRSTSTGVLSGKTLSLRTVRFDNRQKVLSRGVVRVVVSGRSISLRTTETMAATKKRYTSTRLNLKRR